MKKVKLLCPKCNSEDVLCDAYAKWCVETQDWVLSSVHDNIICSDCGNEVTPKEEEIDD